METSRFTTMNKMGRLVRLILKRRIPHTVVSWRFALPGQGQAVKMHRAVFARAWGRLPRWAWGLIFLYSQMVWICVCSWKEIIAALYRHGTETRRRFDVSLLRQAVDLFELCLLHGIPASSYYTYRLHRQPRERWLHYVYHHELPHWHTVVCGPVNLTEAVQLLSDKHAFSRTMTKVGIPTPETIVFLPCGKPIDATTIFLRRSLFCKPNTGNRGKGCFALHYDCTIDNYRVTDEPGVTGKEAVYNYVKGKAAKQDYLVQPLLGNHPGIRRIWDQPRLATIRLVTGHDGKQAVAIGAVLELPQSDESENWWMVQVECRTGALLPHAPQHLPVHMAEQELAGELAGLVVPCWQEALDSCLHAHQSLSAVASIGWDVAITPSGAVLLEGNFNWRTDMLQRISGVPLLETELLRIYSSRLWPHGPGV